MIKAFIFDLMIVKSALFFLRVVDFFWDAYELGKGWVLKASNAEVVSNQTIEQTKPSYLVQ